MSFPLARLGRDLADLITPVACAGCGRSDIALCDSCAAELFSPLRRVDADARYLAGLLPTWAACSYPRVRSIVLAYKNHTRRDIATTIRAAAHSAGDQFMGAASAESHVAYHLADHLHRGGALVLVPAPSGRSRRWRRRLVAAELADALAHGIAEAAAIRIGRPARIATADILRKPLAAEVSGHLAGLNSSDRAAARRHAVTVVAPLRPDDVVLLVDDVVTTGATLAASYRALKAARIRVAGAIALAATPASSNGLAGERSSKRKADYT